MFQYLIRRLMSSVPTVIGVALITFMIYNVVMGDPCITITGKHANAAVIRECQMALGLDRSLPEQFIEYVRQIVTFDFGYSLATKLSIRDMILDGVGPSLALAIPAFLLTVVIAVMVSLASAYFRRGWVDTLMTEICISGMSVSQLFLILVGQYYLAYKFGLFPVSGYERGFPGFIPYIILPSILWVVVGLGYEVRFFRTSILAETQQDYVRTARAKGLDEKKVFLKHIFRNGSTPIINSVVVEIPVLIMGSLLLERFFGIPGLGSMMVDALNSQDFPVVRALTTVISILTIFGNVLADVCVALADPRVSLK